MSEVQEHAPGSFCWFELGTTDQDESKKFYTDLFGWGINDVPAGPDMIYTMLQHQGKDVAALYALNEEQRTQGVPPHWLNYVSVENVDEAVETVKTLGGTVLMGPFDVFDAGRMAVIQDPTSATIALWQPKTHIGAGYVGEPNTVCWNELATTDAEAAGAFYTGLFGWGTRVQDMGPGPYTIFLQGEKQAAGMLQMTEEWGDIPPHWMTYFAVADCDERAARAKTLGAQVKVPPTDIPKIGRFAVLQDPQGAVFSIIKLVPQEAEVTTEAEATA